jgi:ergothioneine biosynthesis protein EgtB
MGNTTLLTRYERVRRATLDLAAPLSAEDCQAQSMLEASPVKWHLAHTTWFFDTFVLGRAGRAERLLFNSYYDSFGERIARDRRGLLTRPSLQDVLRYRERVDEEVSALLDREGPSSLAELGLQHEQQHQELILTDVKHLFFANPLRPEYLSPADDEESPVATPARMLPFEGGLTFIGHDDDAEFSFDNERPRHRRFVEPFDLASRPVTCGEFLRFMEDDGYRRPELWLSDGWEAVQREGWKAPLYWVRDPEAWRIFTLSGMRRLDPDEPVCHVSYYEAEAFARWAGARLPAEDEWEVAARSCPREGNLAESKRYHPRPAPAPVDGGPPVQMFGDVWEWTRSAYGPYPGYRAPSGALGEYNAKFMSNQVVLRGGSCATPASHVRATYRNFFPPHSRWQFTGVRLAR